jgi:hypothetical protein
MQMAGKVSFGAYAIQLIAIEEKGRFMRNKGRLITRLAFFLVVSLIVSAHAQYPASAFLHKEDTSYTIIAYKLNAAEEGLFKPDGRVSCFWYAWDSVASMSSGTMDSSSRMYWSAASKSEVDCKISMRCAYSDKGVYMLMKVMDDNFIHYENPWNIFGSADGLRIYLSRHSAEELYSGADSLFKNIHQTQVAQCIGGLSVPFGGVFSLEKALWYWGLTLERPTGHGDQFFWGESLFTYVSASVNWGIIADCDYRENPRCQEWFFPWSHLSLMNCEVSPGQYGRRFALSIAYNDQDSQDSAGAFGWRNRADPFTSGKYPADDSIGSVDCWGDILLGTALDSVLMKSGIALSGYGCRACISLGNQKARKSAGLSMNEGDFVYYTINGKRIAGPSFGHGLTIKSSLHSSAVRRMLTIISK